MVILNKTKNFIIIILLLLISVVTEAQEVNVYPFFFEIPGTWYVEGGNGSHHLFAKGGTGYMQPPLIMAESCISNKKQNCVKEAVNPSPYNPATQKEAYKRICAMRLLL